MWSVSVYWRPCCGACSTNCQNFSARYPQYLHLKFAREHIGESYMYGDTCKIGVVSCSLLCSQQKFLIVVELEQIYLYTVDSLNVGTSVQHVSTTLSGCPDYPKFNQL